MPPAFDLRTAADRVAAVAAGVRDDQLADPTPCEEMAVRDLLSHLLGLAAAFRRAAEKDPDDDARPGAIPPLPDGWRAELPARLDQLVLAWRHPAAWEGEASAGGVTAPAPEMAAVALDELVLHGWDLAVATRQPYSVDVADLEVVLAFTGAVADAPPEDREGLFGPVVEVPADAPPLARALGLAGRDPAWQPPARPPAL